MANRDIITRSGKGSELDATDYDQNQNSFAGTVETQSGATYTVVYTDQNKTIELNNASMTVTLTTIATIAGQIDTDNFRVTLLNINAADATVNRAGTDTIGDGSATSITLSQYEAVTLQTDTTGGIWRIVPSRVISAATLDEPDINNATSITMDRATSVRTIDFTDGGANVISLYADAATSSYDIFLNDAKNGRNVWQYDESANEFIIVNAALTAPNGGTLTGVTLTTPTITNPVINGATLSTLVLNTKVIDIGDWNMDSTVQVSIAHGLTYSKIRTFEAFIINDTSTTLYPLNTENGGYANIDGANIVLNRSTSGIFDNTGHDSTSFNRGWITIQYVT